MFNRFKQWLRNRFLNYIDESLPQVDGFLVQSSGISMSRRQTPGAVCYLFVLPESIDFNYEADEYDMEVIENEPETIAEVAAFIEVVARLSETPPKEMMN